MKTAEPATHPWKDDRIPEPLPPLPERLQYLALMSDAPSRTFPSALVALVAWLLPGGGYALLGQWARALTVGITIIVLFVAGLLIGGVRVIEVPGWGDHGQKLVVDAQGQVTEEHPGEEEDRPWVLTAAPLTEVRNKPWYIAQFLAGPINIAASAASIWASRDRPTGGAIAARSHARTNELGVLYTAVAGMLNLLAIIDSAHRAGPHAAECK